MFVYCEDLEESTELCLYLAHGHFTLPLQMLCMSIEHTGTVCAPTASMINLHAVKNFVHAYVSAWPLIC